LIALRQHAERFGELSPDRPVVHARRDLQRALDSIDRPTRGVLERTAARITAFAEAQRRSIHPLDVSVTGGRAGHDLAPVDRAGCYVPGGRYPLVSTALMTACTARSAGVSEVWIASPRPSETMLAAAAIGGTDAVLAAGGAQAIAALAFGAPPDIPACDVIVGPGNRFVTAAKHIVSDVVRIDMTAGPSELIVVADESASAQLVAADLLAQAEHDVDARAHLVAAQSLFIDRVETEIARQLDISPAADVARSALRDSIAIAVSGLAAAADVCNQLAPEHLHLHVRDPRSLKSQLRHYGSLFLGASSPEVFGDYGIGPNHVLPTAGSARSFGGLSVVNFLRMRTWIEMDSGDRAASEIADDAAALARLEGLEFHARSADLRGA
jgi:phosphoribosyl-ATP pyrophosphohydrolase/phosphoribosyl-AMP cyclohydrolase/histidinol dehydrogenase